LSNATSRECGGRQIYGCQTTAHTTAKRGAPNDPQLGWAPPGLLPTRIIWAFNCRQMLIVLRMWAPMSGRDSGGRQIYGCQTTAHTPAKRGAPNDPQLGWAPPGLLPARIIWAFNCRQMLIVLRMWAPMSGRDSGGTQKYAGRPPRTHPPSGVPPMTRKEVGPRRGYY